MSARTTAPDRPATDDAAYASAWREWHAAHERQMGDPHGFLAVTSLNWLDATPARFDDAPGQWWSDEDGVHASFSAEDGVELDGRPVVGRHDFGTVPERAGLSLPWRDAVIEIAKRGGRDILRPRHPDAPLVSGYRGTPTYPPSTRWVVPGHFTPFAEPRPTSVGSVVDGLRHVYDALGRVEFELAGRSHRLTAFGGPGGGLHLLFRDATSGVTTYAASRSLTVAAPDDQGRVVLDFNRAVNLPCAYTDLATCPLPPTENVLAVAVEAGEQIPYERHS